MRTIREHIKNRTFASCYLITGKEEYLKSLYRDKLVNALVSGPDSMNYTRFDGAKPDLNEVSDLGITPPFLEEYRVLLFTATGLFKASNDLAKRMKEFPESTVCIFVENEADKRNELYKYVKEHGYITEINGLDEKDLLLFIGSELKKANVAVTEKTAAYLLDQVGTDMNRLKSEIEKLACYCMDKGTADISDVDRICCFVADVRIYKMLDAILEKNGTKALKLYGELLEMHEKPMGILYALTRAYSQFAEVKELSDRGMNINEIAGKLSLQPFVVTKYFKMRNMVSVTELVNAVSLGTELEQKIKTGDLDETIAAEIYITEGSGKQEKRSNG